MKWTEPERHILEWAESEGIKPVALVALGLLPGRDALAIHNQFGLMRAKLRGVCAKCRKPWVGAGWCGDCKRRVHAKVQENKAAGLCECGRDRTGGSATRCVRCMGTQKAGRKLFVAKRGKQAKARKKVTGVVSAELRLLPWPVTKNLNTLAWLAMGSDVVDLFGGSGRLVHAVAKAGLSRVAVWNDIHPLAYAFMQRVKAGRILEVLEDSQALIAQAENVGELVRRYKEADVADPLGPALLHAVARVHRGRMGQLGGKGVKLPKDWKTKPVGIERLADFTTAFIDVELRNQSYEFVLKDWDKPGVLFLADPPWPGPGGDSGFEHAMDGEAFCLLVQRLLGLKRAKWALVVASSDLVVRMLSKAGVVHRGCRTAWLTTVYGKEILVTSPDWIVGEGVEFSLRSLVPEASGSKLHSPR